MGSAYHKVYVTWEEGPPSGKYDHYVLFIDEETGLLSKVHYTLRDAPDFAPALFAGLLRAVSAGTMHFSDYREVDGVLFPFDQIVTAFGPNQAQADASESFFHRVKVETATFASLSATDLVIDPSRGTPGDRK